jgi:methyltransferase-like protein 6
MSAPPDAANASASPTAASLPYDSEVLQLSYEAGSTASSASPASFTPAELAHYNSILSSQGPGSVRDFFLAKYESESVRNWDRMYRRHEDRAYKDRHYLTEEFRELGETMRADRAARGELPVAVPASQPEAEDDNDADAQPSAASSSSSAKSPPLRPIAEPTSVPSEKQRRLLEVGCGVGNALFPLLRLHPDLFCYGVDCSKNAIQVVQNHPDYDASGRAAAWVVDLVTEDLPLPIRSDHLDFATLIFVLSSIHPEKMHRGLRTIWRAMKKGEGVLFVRD